MLSAEHLALMLETQPLAVAVTGAAPVTVAWTAAISPVQALAVALEACWQPCLAH